MIVGGNRLSVLTAGESNAEPLLLLHGTFWSRVWEPVLPALGEWFHCLELDLPGFGRSDGELGVEQASVPSLAELVLEAAYGLGLQSFHVAAHDIGGAVAQHLVARYPGQVRRMVLMNAVMFDSWPVPAVTLDAVPDLVERAVPTRLIWGRDDEFQKIEYARRYVQEIPNSDLVEVPGRHIPTEDAPEMVAAATVEHLTRRSR